MAKQNTQINLSYTVKDQRGLIEDKSKKFTNLNDSVSYFRDVKAGKYGQLIGKPIFDLK